MTTHNTKLVWCDHDDGYCEETLPTSHDDDTLARREAARWGWTSPERDMDLCPEHSKATP